MVIGIICEYSPFHNGHIYHIQKIKEKYPDSLLILCLNGYFLQRGEPSILTKEDKTKIALFYGVDLVVEIPVLFGTQSADTFAHTALEILHALNVQKIIFGSESNDLAYLEKIAKKQLSTHFSLSSSKSNYPKRLLESLEEDTIIEPNDLLGISYIKAILQNHYPISYECIQRTNSYHDTQSDEEIVSASNIRKKYLEKKPIHKYLPKESLEAMIPLDDDIFFRLLKYKILTDPHLENYLDVTEGLEFLLKKKVVEVSSYSELLEAMKSKRYTYNRQRRMLFHIFLGILKTDSQISLSYLHILGFNSKGKNYLHQKKKDFLLPIQVDRDSKLYQYEIRASLFYDLCYHTHTFTFEQRNIPYIFTDSKESNQK